jgi:PEP-CTERM motif
LGIRPSVALVIATVLIWMSPAGTRAEPVRWSYSTYVYANGGPLEADVVRGQDVVAGVGFTAFSRSYSSGSATIEVFRPTAFNNTPDWVALDPATGSYLLTVFLWDEASGENSWVTLPGSLSGQLDPLANQPGPSASQLTNTFTGPARGDLTLGGNHYSVQLGPYVPASQVPYPFGNYDGSLYATVGVNVPTPEPESLTLAALGVLGVLVGAYRRWQPRRPA